MAQDTHPDHERPTVDRIPITADTRQRAEAHPFRGGWER